MIGICGCSSGSKLLHVLLGTRRCLCCFEARVVFPLNREQIRYTSSCLISTDSSLP